MTIPQEAKKIAEKTRKMNYFLFGLCLFFPLIAMIAIFGFCVSISLDLEYEDITQAQASLYYFLTIFISLLVGCPFLVIGCYNIYKVKTNKCSAIYIDEHYVYFKYDLGSSTAIPLDKIIGYDDDKEYVKTIYDLGKKKGFFATIKESMKIMTIRYKENNEIKKIEAIVENQKDVEFSIAQAAANARSLSYSNNLEIEGTRMETLNPCYMFIAIVIMLGILAIFWMLFGFEIDDYNTGVDFGWIEPGDINVGKLVAYATCSLLGTPLPFIAGRFYCEYRHQPLALIATDGQSRKAYLYNKNKYIVISFDDIISAKGIHTKERVTTGQYQIKNFETGRYETHYTYANVTTPRGLIKIKYKTNSGVKNYSVRVRYVDNVSLGGRVS